jgi:uncharacterized membrane protein YfcA
MFPISVIIAVLANSSGFSGGILFQPIYNLFMHIPIQNAVATGIATETVGMTSGALRYIYYRQTDLAIGFLMIMLTIPGVVVGNHALIIINGDLLKFILGFILLFIATTQLFGAIQKNFGTKDRIPVEDVYGYMWAPPLGGFFSATTGTGMCEITQPVLEKNMKLKTKKANATAILIEATGDWIITILNLHAGLIMWDLWIFTGTGVIIGGQIGPYVSKYLPDRIIKSVFAIAVIFISIFYIWKGSVWLMNEFAH